MGPTRRCEGRAPTASRVQSIEWWQRAGITREGSLGTSGAVIRLIEAVWQARFGPPTNDYSFAASSLA
ncbi:protein of unknown function [Pararobbsia alpina]